MWEAPTPDAPRDPLSIGVAILVNVGWTGAITGLGATILGSAVIGAALFGASLAASAFQQKPGSNQASPSDRQATVRQSVGPRWRFYGRNKVGGTLWFFESQDGTLYQGITLNHGQISEIKEIWLNDQRVSVDPNGFVYELPYSGGYVKIKFKSGTASQTVHSELLGRFPVGESHRLAGIANALAMFTEVPAERITEVYPQGNPALRVVMDASLVKDVRTGVANVWRDNPADCIYDYLTSVDPAGFPNGAGFTESQVDLQSFQDFADLCDEPVPLKDGGYISRYRMWGGYALNEPMSEVLPRMCATCDADLYMTGEGKIAIRGGKWVEPALVLDDSLGHILSGEFRQGQSSLAAFNELTITFLDPALDYQESEGDVWIDTDNVALRGKVLSEQLTLTMVPSHAQARRLAKIHTKKSNPKWSGVVTTNFYGLNALGETTVRIKFAPLGIDEDFLIQSVRILDDLAGVQLSVSSLDASAYEWDPETEQGDGPTEPPETATPDELAPPEDFEVHAITGVYLEATWSPLDRPSLSVEVQYRLSPAGVWLSMTVDQDEQTALSAAVTSGADFDVRTRVVSPGGVPGPWSATTTVTATP